MVRIQVLPDLPHGLFQGGIATTECPYPMRPGQLELEVSLGFYVLEQNGNHYGVVFVGDGEFFDDLLGFLGVRGEDQGHDMRGLHRRNDGGAPACSRQDISRGYPARNALAFEFVAERVGEHGIGMLVADENVFLHRRPWGMRHSHMAAPRLGFIAYSFVLSNLGLHGNGAAHSCRLQALNVGVGIGATCAAMGQAGRCGPAWKRE